jgi:DNA-binding CsgD family transcriptional regulator
MGYSCASIFLPLVDSKNMYAVAYQFPHIFYINIFFNCTITSGCCFLAVHWLRYTQIKPSFKLCSLFSVIFIIFSFFVTILWIAIRKNVSLSPWIFTFLGALLIGIMLLLFYLYTSLISNVNKEDSVIADNYSQFIRQLTRREQEVVDAVLAGNKRYKEIAGKLGISVSTVKSHLKHIYQVTGFSNVAGLFSFFREYNQNIPPNSP